MSDELDEELKKTIKVLQQKLAHHEAQEKSHERELIASEKRFRKLSNIAFEGILIHSQGTCLDVNDAATRISGYGREELIGKNLINLLIPEKYHPLVFEKIEENTPTPYEIEIKRKDGSFLWINIMSENMEWEDEKFRVTSIRDITERKKIKEELFRAKEKAEESDRLKTAFLQNISHEIRTPLNGIMGFSQLLSEDDLPPEKVRKYSKIIENKSRDLLRIIMDILEMSRIETHQLEVFEEKFYIRELRQSLYEDFKHIAEEKRIDFVFHPDDTTPDASMSSDKEKIKTILTKLLDNAFKFTKSGVVSCSCKVSDTETTFSVSDTGIGIPEKMRNKLFRKFVQSDSSLNREYGGSGVGLYIARVFTEFLGGKIWYESVEGKGSTFYVLLPLVQ